MSTTDELVDRIDRQIDIDAPAEQVYALVARPGWWINDGTVDAEPTYRRDGDVTVLVHPTHGECRLQVLEEDPPRHVAFTWIDAVAPEAGTRVEFWVEDRPGGGVTLKVSESGFTGLRRDRASIAQRVVDNTHGWEVELEAARRYVAGATA